MNKLGDVILNKFTNRVHIRTGVFSSICLHTGFEYLGSPTAYITIKNVRLLDILYAEDK